MKVFNDKEYNFIDSIIEFIKLDDKMYDFLIGINYFGPQKDELIILRVKNVEKFVIHNTWHYDLNDKYTPYTIANIIKSKDSNSNLTKLIIENFLSEKENDDEPLIYCLCEEVYIESMENIYEEDYNA